MTISESLQEFYKDNNFPNDGGESKDFFELKFRLFTLKLPNSQFRKNVIHIHDIQHLIYNCDTSWKGEAFIAGWEIGTKMWKHFPIGFMSLWAMGFSILNYPKEVLKGYKEGINSIGIMDLEMDRKMLLSLSISELKSMIKKESKRDFNWLVFLFWLLVSEVVFFFPLIFLTFIFIAYIL